MWFFSRLFSRYDKNGFNKKWIHKDTGTKFDKNWYDKDWYDKIWYDRNWYDKFWHTRNFYRSEASKSEKYVQYNWTLMTLEEAKKAMEDH